MQYIDPSLPCADKLAFDSRKEAAATAVVAFHRYGTKMYPYVCRYCGLWHLSSRSNNNGDDYA